MFLYSFMTVFLFLLLGPSKQEDNYKYPGSKYQDYDDNKDDNNNIYYKRKNNSKENKNCIFVVISGRLEKNLVILGGFTTKTINSKTPRVLTLNPTTLSPSLPKCSFPPLPTPTSSHTTAILESGALLSCGGFVGAGLNKTSSCWTSTQGSSSWTSHPPLPHPTAGSTMTSLSTGTVVLAGGWTDQPVAQTWKLSKKGVWVEGPDMQTARTAHCALAWEREEGDVMVIGGRTTKFGWVSSVEAFFLEDDTSTFLPSLPSPRAGHGCAVARRESSPVVLVAGGLGRGNKALDTVLMLEKGAWLEVSPLPGARYGHVMVPLGGELRIYGGADSGRNPVYTSLRLRMKGGQFKWEEMSGNITVYYHTALLVPGFD